MGALFVCFAEDPAACKQNRPTEYQRLIGVNATMMEVAQAVGVEAGPATGQTNMGQTNMVQTGAPMQQQQYQVQQGQPQQVVYVQQQPPQYQGQPQGQAPPSYEGP